MSATIIVSGIPVPAHVIERFRAQAPVGDSAECWPWPGFKTPAGYGNVRFQIAGKTRHVYTHRLAYALATGRDPADLFVRHTCDNPPCCNPAHLLIGTPADNVQDRTDRGRHRTNPPRGEATGAAKLTDAAVALIRQIYAAGTATQLELGDAFGVSYQTIGAIVRGEKWAHIDGPRTRVGTGYASRRGLQAVTR